MEGRTDEERQLIGFWQTQKRAHAFGVSMLLTFEQNFSLPAPSLPHAIMHGLQQDSPLSYDL